MSIIGFTAFTLVCVFHAVSVTSLELVANYKFWDSVSSRIIYDYSGNSRHGEIVNPDKLIITDRGVTNDGDYLRPRCMSLTSIPAQGYSDFAFTLWSLRISNSAQLYNDIGNGATAYRNIYYDLSGTSTEIKFKHLGTILGSSNHSAINGWNLFTIRLYSTCGSSSQRCLELYNNLVSLTYFLTDFPELKTFNTNLISMIMYELWAHAGLSSINDLNYLIYNNSPTLPSSYFVPENPYKNKLGNDCPNICSSNKLGCDTNLYCIQKDKNDCFYGLYHRESGNCIFYCPDSSCSCSSNMIHKEPNSELKLSTFSCSCKEGFKKISDDFVGCVPDYWVDYHKEGYKYVIDTLIQGYSLDNNGDCCICEENYAAVSTSPLICMYIPNCLQHIQEEDKFICSECKKGYQLNYEAQCLECSEGYEKVSEDIQECTRKIERCHEYINIEDTWKCKECNSGYQLSSSGVCDECQKGYLKIQASSLLCIAEILSCIEYDISSEDSKCKICKAGYMLNFNNQCSSCEIEYFEVSSDHLECAYKRERCISYKRYEGDWLCDICEEGYKLDNEMNCNLCAEGYSSASKEVLECILNENSTTDSENNSHNIEEDILEEDEEFELKTSNIMVKNSATITKGATITSAGASMLSLNLDSFFSTLGTTQLISYILLYNINIPIRAKVILEGISIISIVPNIFEYFIPKEDTLNIPRYKRADINNELFLINSGKMITIILFPTGVVLVLKILNRYTQKLNDSNSIKNVISKLLLNLEWKFVLGNLIQGTLELSISSLINLYYVSFFNFHSVIGFSISIVVFVRYI
jgi:hypothetical protein